jgi:hypothetical protein
MKLAANFSTSFASVVDTGGKFASGANKYRWQTMGTIIKLLPTLKKKMHLYANSTTQRCPKEIMKIFVIEDFFHLPAVVRLQLRISP